MEETNTKTVSIPKVLADKVKNRCEGTGFNSVSSYVTYIIREVIFNLERKDSEGKKAEFSNEEEKVKQKLNSLGYL